MRDVNKIKTLKELKIELEAIAKLRPELMSMRAREGFNSKDFVEAMQNLLNLYTVIGSNAEAYVEALNEVTKDDDKKAA